MSSWGEVTEVVSRARDVMKATEDALVVAVATGRKRRKVKIAQHEAFGEPWIEITCVIGVPQRFDLAAVMRHAAELPIGSAMLDGDRIRLRCAVPLARYEADELDEIVELIGREAAIMARLGWSSARSA